MLRTLSFTRITNIKVIALISAATRMNGLPLGAGKQSGYNCAFHALAINIFFKENRLKYLWKTLCTSLTYS
jgi:hypothetical protein